MSYERLEQLMDEASELPHSPAQVAVLEEAVRIADSLNNVDASVRTRMELVTAATFSGADEKALVAFAWILARFDEEPECVDLYSLLWKYKWIIGSIASFPTVSLEKIHKMEADMETRYAAGGFNLRPVYRSRADNAMVIGDKQQCLHFFEQWKATPRDMLADCIACEQNSKIRYLNYFGRYEEALKAAEPIFSGDMSCSTVPQTTYGYVLTPLMHLGRLDEAREYHEIGYPTVQGNPDYITAISLHLLFLTRNQNYDKAVGCVERHLPLVWGMAMVDQRMKFYCAVATLLEKLSASRDEIGLRVPEQMSLGTSTAHKTVELANWFQAETNKLAAKFDARNGNTAVTTANAKWRELGLGA
jgi:tetratricopeptide (TPR) repeat protein